MAAPSRVYFLERYSWSKAAPLSVVGDATMCLFVFGSTLAETRVLICSCAWRPSSSVAVNFVLLDVICVFCFF